MKWITVLYTIVLGTFYNIRASLESCAITNTTIRFSRNETILRSIDNPTFVIAGITTGSRFTKVEWYRGGELLQHGSLHYLGGGETIKETGACETFQYRVAILIRNRIPGVYHYKVYNSISTEGVESDRLTVTNTFDPPTNVVLRQMIDNRILVTWTAPEGATQYRVYLHDEDVQGRGRPTFFPSYLVDNSFSAGDTVIVRVRAIHHPFWSLPTETSTYTVLIMKEPEAYVVSVGVDSVTLYFSQPINSLSANQYEVTFYCEVGGGKRKVFNEQQLITMEGLQNGCKYTVEVVATNTHAGLSSLSVNATNFKTRTQIFDWTEFALSSIVIVFAEIVYALLYSLLFTLVYFRQRIIGICRPKRYKSKQNHPEHVEKESSSDNLSYWRRRRQSSSYQS